VFSYARAWLWHMVAGFLFLDGSGNIISWLMLPLLHLEWDIIGTYSWGQLHWPGCTVRYAMGARGSGRTPTSEVACTSYRSICGSISRSLGHTVTPLRFAITYLFSLYIFFCGLCLANNMEYNFQPWPFEDAESKP
jgi:hypothetical protein